MSRKPPQRLAIAGYRDFVQFRTQKVWTRGTRSLCVQVLEDGHRVLLAELDAAAADGSPPSGFAREFRWLVEFLEEATKDYIAHTEQELSDDARRGSATRRRA